MRHNKPAGHQTLNQTDGIGPEQPIPGKQPPNLGHNGNGAKNSNGNYHSNNR